MCNHRILIFFAQILHGTLEYGSTQTVEVQEGSEKKGGIGAPYCLAILLVSLALPGSYSACPTGFASLLHSEFLGLNI